MYAVGVEKVFAFLVRCESALSTAKTLARETPQQPLALDAESGGRGRQNDEIVGCRARDWVDESLKSLLIDVLLLQTSQLIHLRATYDKCSLIQDLLFRPISTIESRVS